MVYFDQTLHTYTLGKSNEEGKDQEYIQSNTTPDPGYHMEKFPILCPRSGVLFENVTKTTQKNNIAKRSDLSQQVTTRMHHANIRLTTGMHKNLVS